MIVDTSHFSFVNIMNSRVVKTLTELSQSKLTNHKDASLLSCWNMIIATHVVNCFSQVLF